MATATNPARLWSERETDDSEPSAPSDDDEYVPSHPVKRSKKKLTKKEREARDRRREERQKARDEKQKTLEIRLASQHDMFSQVAAWIGEDPPEKLGADFEWLTVHRYDPIDGLDMNVGLPKAPAMSKALVHRVGSTEMFSKMVRFYSAVKKSVEILRDDLESIDKHRDATKNQITHFSRILTKLAPFVEPVLNTPPTAAQMRLENIKHIWPELMTIIPILLARMFKQASPNITANVHVPTARKRAPRRFVEYNSDAPEFAVFGECDQVAVVRHTPATPTVIYELHCNADADGDSNTVVCWSKSEVVDDSDSDSDAGEVIPDRLYTKRKVAANVDNIVSLPTGEVVFETLDDRLELFGRFSLPTTPRLWCPMAKGIMYSQGNAIMHVGPDGVQEYTEAKADMTLTHLESASNGNTRKYALLAAYDVSDQHASIFHIAIISKESFTTKDLTIEDGVITRIIPIPCNAQTSRAILRIRKANLEIQYWVYSPQHDDLIPLFIPYYTSRYLNHQTTDYETGLITMQEKILWSDDEPSLVQVRIDIEEKAKPTEYNPDVSKGNRRARLRRVRILHKNTNYRYMTTSPSGSQYAIRHDITNDSVEVHTLVRI